MHLHLLLGLKEIKHCRRLEEELVGLRLILFLVLQEVVPLQEEGMQAPALLREVMPL